MKLTERQKQLIKNVSETQKYYYDFLSELMPAVELWLKKNKIQYLNLIINKVDIENNIIHIGTTNGTGVVYEREKKHSIPFSEIEFQNDIEPTDTVILRMIKEKFPDLEVTIDELRSIDNEKCVSIKDTEIYYSDEYQELIMDIKVNFLWKNNIINYLFVHK